MSLPANPPDLLNLRAIRTVDDCGESRAGAPGAEDGLSAPSTPSARAQEGFVSGEVIKVKATNQRGCGCGLFSCQFDCLVDSLSFHGTGTEISVEILRSVQAKLHKHAALNYYGMLYQIPGCLVWYIPVILVLLALVSAATLGVMECERYAAGRAITPDCVLRNHSLCVQSDPDTRLADHLYQQMFYACFLGFVINLVVSPLFLIIIIPRIVWCSLHRLLLRLTETELSSSHILLYAQHQTESRYLAYVPIFSKPPCIYFIEYDIKPCQEHLAPTSDCIWSYLITYMDRLVTGKLHTCMFRDRRHLVVDDHICICQLVEHRKASPLYCCCRLCLWKSRSSEEDEMREEML